MVRSTNLEGVLGNSNYGSIHKSARGVGKQNYGRIHESDRDVVGRDKEQ